MMTLLHDSEQTGPSVSMIEVHSHGLLSSQQIQHQHILTAATCSQIDEEPTNDHCPGHVLYAKMQPQARILQFGHFVSITGIPSEERS